MDVGKLVQLIVTDGPRTIALGLYTIEKVKGLISQAHTPAIDHQGQPVTAETVAATFSEAIDQVDAIADAAKGELAKTPGSGVAQS